MLLETLVEQVEAKFPAVVYKDGKGSRAAAAAELVREQKVVRMGEQAGRDWWEVGGHVCSIKGNCDCADNAPLDPNGRKLCKHRIAAMFVCKMQDDHGLTAILRSAKGDRVVLTVQVLSTDNGLRYTLNSYRVDGVETVLDYADRLRFTDAEFAAACRVAGFGMEDRPVKLPGLNHRYILKRGTEMRYTAAAFTAQAVERREREGRLREIAVADEMDAELAAEAV